MNHTHRWLDVLPDDDSEITQQQCIRTGCTALRLKTGEAVTPRPTPRPKQEVIPIRRKVLAKVTKAEDLEVHTCKATMAGVTVLDIRDYVPSTKTYGRGTTLPWNTETLKILNVALVAAAKEEKNRA